MQSPRGRTLITRQLRKVSPPASLPCQAQQRLRSWSEGCGSPTANCSRWGSIKTRSPDFFDAGALSLRQRPHSGRNASGILSAPRRSKRDRGDEPRQYVARRPVGHCRCRTKRWNGKCAAVRHASSAARIFRSVGLLAGASASTLGTKSVFHASELVPIRARPLPACHPSTDHV